MNDWSSGYTTDIDYTFGYYPELNPARVRLAFLDAGLAFPEFSTACELGFGQGLSINFHAAASNVRWWGTDFNPAQAGFARELGSVSGADPLLLDDAFEEFALRDDIPEFDYIGLHGIWSWVSDDTRAAIVDFLRRKLKVGGVLYISYNTLPGWSSFAPMRHLMSLHADLLGSKGRGAVACATDAMAFAEKMLACNPRYAAVSPDVPGRLERMKTQDPRYIAHEYFNREWAPMYFSEIAQWLSSAKLTYACSANYNDHVRALNLTPEQQALIDGVPGAVMRESVRDVIVNQQFRKDYWVKGARRIGGFDRSERLRDQRVMLVSARQDAKPEFTGVMKVKANEEIYGALLDLIADHVPRTLREIERALQGRMSMGQLLEASLLLLGAGHLAVVQSPEEIDAARPRTDRLNAWLMQKARGSSDVGFLVSPVIGGAVPVSRPQQLCLLARSQGVADSGQWARYAWRILSAQGGRMLRDGKPIETDEGNLEELLRQARVLETNRIPVLKALGIV